MTFTKVLAIVVAFIVAFTAGIWLAIWQPQVLSTAPTTPTVSVSSSASPLASETPTTAPLVSRGPAVEYTGEAMAMGDYVMVSAKKCLAKAGFVIDAKTDRRASDVAADLQAMGQENIPGGVVLHVGANGGATAADLDAIMAVLGPDRVVVFSTIQIPDDPTRYTFEQSTNDNVNALAQRYPNVRIMSWNATSLTNVTWLNKDMSMTDAGCKEFARQAESVLRAKM